MSKSHTNTGRAADIGGELKIIPGLGLADLDDSGLPERLAGKVEGELELFADRMRHGLLAAAVAVGLQVFDQLLQAEPAKVGLGGRLIDVAMPRVRSTDGTGEIGLETWAALADTRTCWPSTRWCRSSPACPPATTRRSSNPPAPTSSMHRHRRRSRRCRALCQGHRCAPR